VGSDAESGEQLSDDDASEMSEPRAPIPPTAPTAPRVVHLGGNDDECQDGDQHGVEEAEEEDEKQPLPIKLVAPVEEQDDEIYEDTVIEADWTQADDEANQRALAKVNLIRESMFINKPLLVQVGRIVNRIEMREKEKEARGAAADSDDDLIEMCVF
jgi:hypothetical protein